MQLAIFGATGRTGRILAQNALQQGHAVSALVREPTRLAVEHPQLNAILGDLSDSTAVHGVVAGSKAVISVVGPAPQGPKDVLATAARQITAAMQAHGVRRLIFLTGAGVRHPQDAASLGALIFIPLLKLLAPQVLADAEQAAELIMHSGLDWTVVRAPRLGNGPPRGRYRSGYLRPAFTPLSRADLADFLLQQIEDPAYLKAAPLVSY